MKRIFSLMLLAAVSLLAASCHGEGGEEETLPPGNESGYYEFPLNVQEGGFKAAGNGEYFFKAFVKLLGEGKLASCDAWLYLYEQGREDMKWDPIQVWKLESNTPVDSMGWNQVGLDADGNDKSFQLWYNKGVDRNGKAPTQQAGARELLVDDFEFTHAILWVTCGMDGAVAMTYAIDDAELFVKPVVK